MDLFALRSIALRAMVEAAGDDEEEKKKQDEEKKKKQQDQENAEQEEETPAEDDTTEEDTQEENPDEQTEEETPEDNSDEGDPAPEDTPADDAGGEDPPPDGEEAPVDGDVPDAGGDDFSMDPEGGEEEDLGPAPDGLPEADDDGSGDMESDEEEDQETNIQINILKLSELDRVLAKKNCFQFFIDLKAKVQANLAIIEKNETVIDPDVRDQIVEKLNTVTLQLNQFLEYKFPIMNYEEAIQSYYIFVKDINTALEEVRNDGIIGRKPKHKNKESS
ncbi:MAG: hypothetical protein NC114_06415 [Ruminococcus flavefaciens]|nr:hypothetical protein [Ruminococcus flavefaciens]